MKKVLLLTLVSVLLLLAFSACNLLPNKDSITLDSDHTHEYANEWSSDNENHYHECECGEEKDTAPHLDENKDTLCDVCGAKVAECTHDWTAATCTTAATCKLCGATGEAALGHTEEALSAVGATCTSTGLTAGVKCSVCGTTITAQTETEKLNHSYTESMKDETNHWIECACGDKANVTAHEFEWIIDKAATEAEEGLKHEECSCGQKRNENTTIPALPHTHSYIWVAGTSSTCETNGTIDHYECSGICGKYFDAEKNEISSIEAALADHTYGDMIGATASTCVTHGTVDYYQCSVCNKYFDAEKNEIASIVAALADHTYGDLNPANAPTCQAEGNIAYYQCSVEGCGKLFDESKALITSYVLAKVAHNWVANTDRVGATCATEGCDATGYAVWQLLTDASTLKAGDQIIIASAKGDYVMGSDRGNNRTAIAITDGNVFVDGVAVITLGTGTEDSTLFTFIVEGGKLYAASSNNNHLKTNNGSGENYEWEILVTSGKTTVIAKNSTNKNILKFNSTNTPPIFSCYASGQAEIVVYVLSYAECTADHDTTDNVGEMNVNSATCTVDGSKDIYCLDCGKIIRNETIVAEGHNTTDDGDCTTPVVCTVCTETIVEAKEHDGGTATCQTLAVCTNEGCGKSYGEYADHNMSAATCTEAPKCTTEGCNYTEGSTIPHVYENGACVSCGDPEPVCPHETTRTETKAATCTENGYEKVICEDCGDTVTETAKPALGHNYTEVIQDEAHLKALAADCQSHDAYWYDCANCESSAGDDEDAADKYYETDNTGSHNISTEWTKDNAKHYHECTVDGCDYKADEAAHSYTNFECTCGDVNYSGTYYIATKRSSGNYWYMTNDLGTASTKRYQAVDSGLTTLPSEITSPEDKYVFVVERNADGTYLIYAEGLSSNNYLGWSSDNSGALVAKASAKAVTLTCNKDGTFNISFVADDTRYLSLNNSSNSNYFAWYKDGQKKDLSLIPVNLCDHNYEETKVVDPTCGAMGYTVYTCSECGSTYNGDEVAATGEHNYEVTKVVEATCATNGYTVYTCSECGNSYNGDEVAATGEHNYEEGKCTVCQAKDPEYSAGGGTASYVDTKYTISNYTAGTQYAKNEVHKLDDNVTVTTNDCYFTSEIRIYSSSTNNGYVIIHSEDAMTKITVNAGNKVDTLLVYVSNDGVTWGTALEISVTATSYKDYTLDLGGEYNYIKLDVKGSNQVRVKNFTLTTVTYS